MSVPCYSPLEGYRDPDTGGIVFKRPLRAVVEDMSVACGQCLGCRLNYSSTWAMRIVHEAHDWPFNCFITLTYRDKCDATPDQFRQGHYIPDDFSLSLDHFQRFMKRFRRRVDFPIRYFMCGEYGDKFLRPHYHACIFNFDFSDRRLFREDNGYRLYTSPFLDRLWPYGFSTIGELNYTTAAYCSRYILKKITGVRAEEHYKRVFTGDDNDQLVCGEVYWVRPEFVTMSRRPGIGRNFYDRFSSDFFPSDEVPVPGRGVFKKVPRYYQEVLREADPELFAEIQDRRQSFRAANEEEYTPARLQAKYKCKKAQISQLVRNLE